jgi:predicted Zn-dependent peptidase
VAAPQRRRVVLVDRPGAPQTVIVATRPLPPLAGAVRAARDLADVALGGGFTSRLNQNLREQHGYTYGAGSRIREQEGQPILSVSTSVQTEVTGAALGEIRKELARLTSDGLDAAEATKARETARSGVAAALGTSAALAEALAGDVLAGRGADGLAEEVRALDAAGADAVAAAARSGAFDLGQLAIVLVGDRKAVEPQLAAAGLPAPELVDAEGRPVAR